MSVSVSSFKSSGITVDIANSTTHTITNLSAPTANTEVSHALVSGLKQILIRSRNIARLQFSLVSGESGTKYVTIRAGAVYKTIDLDLTGKTLYIQSSVTSTVIEIEEWS